MTNFDRNTRTLIVSFLVAIFALIPLRFVEIGQQKSVLMDSQVLGESIVVSESSKNEEVKKDLFEAPYNDLEKCISKVDLKAMEEGVIELIQNDALPKEQLIYVLDELQKAEEGVCP